MWSPPRTRSPPPPRRRTCAPSELPPPPRSRTAVRAREAGASDKSGPAPVRSRVRGSAASRARQPVQPQGELDLQSPGGALPVVAEEAGYPLQPLGDGVHMDVQFVLGAGRTHPAREVGVEGARQVGAAPFVVRDDPADRTVDEALDVPVPGQQEAQEAEVLGGGPVPGAA